MTKATTENTKAGDSRLARELDTRTTEERPKQWQPAQLLPEPDKLPGMSYRWIRISTTGKADARNISAKMREGWEAVRVEEQPNMAMLVDPESRFPDGIEIGGLLLCKMPTELAEQRKDYFANKTQQQMQAVDNSLMRENDPRMPLFKEGKSTVTKRTFGDGK